MAGGGYDATFPWMLRLRERWSIAVLLVTLVAWVGGLTAQVAHEASVAHVVCAEHGEVTELHDEAHEAAPAFTDGGEADHDHDCDLAGLPGFGPGAIALGAVVAPPIAVERPAPEPWTAGAPARGPPLSYAPKTSPPHLG